MSGTLFFDGGCGFCTRAVLLLARLDRHRRVRLVPFQAPGAAGEAGVSRDDLARAVFWAGADGGRYRGAEAVNAALSAAFGNAVLSRLYRLPGIGRAQERVYRWVAGNRHRLPGVRPWCVAHPRTC